MPLSFKSENFGNIAFGFFNIETDMLLLEHYFFFATEFAKAISELTHSENMDSFYYEIQGYNLPYENIGNLMGAIHKTEYRGFIGEVYKIFPFPDNMEDFKQHTDGYKNKEIIEKIILKFGSETLIPLVAFNKAGHSQIGEFEFTKKWFFELIKYVLEGGYPGWKDSKMPEYVLKMKNINNFEL
jgi:hypothetical protein